MRQGLAALLFVCALFQCSSTEWRGSPPRDLIGTWIAVSDEITLGQTLADTIRVSATAISVTKFRFGQREPWLRSGPIQRVSITGGKAVVFWGAPDSRTIAEFRYQFDLERSGHFARIGELLATGVNQDDSFLPIGRFVFRP